MEEYISNEKDWDKYAFPDFSRGYTRNLVDEGNGKSNLVSLGRWLNEHQLIIWRSSFLYGPQERVAQYMIMPMHIA